MTETRVSAAISVVLSDEAPRRQPFRSAAHRQPGFDEAFDDDTLVFDAFEESATSTRLVCPPFSNLSAAMTSASFVTVEGGRHLRREIREGVCQHQVTLERRSGSGPFRIRTEFGDFQILPAANRSEEFRGRRVLMTLTKDNELTSIQDWMRYHRDVHGADAVLLFDNRSETYSLDELADAVRVVDGFQIARLVDWPFRYGPQGDENGRHWDSAFTQLGALETARRSYLRGAASVLVGDIDELVVPVTGVSVFEAAERSRFGVVAYHGLWVPRLAEDQVGAPPRHREMTHFERPPLGIKHRVVPGRRYFENKYTVVPSRTPDAAQWNVHAITGLPVSRLVSWRFHVAHYRAVTTGWKYPRGAPVPYSRRRHRRPRALPRALEIVDWDT